jgi:hypothetical protein
MACYQTPKTRIHSTLLTAPRVFPLQLPCRIVPPLSRLRASGRRADAPTVADSPCHASSCGAKGAAAGCVFTPAVAALPIESRPVSVSTGSTSCSSSSSRLASAAGVAAVLVCVPVEKSTGGTDESRLRVRLQQSRSSVITRAGRRASAPAVDAQTQCSPQRAAQSCSRREQWTGDTATGDTPTGDRPTGDRPTASVQTGSSSSSRSCNCSRRCCGVAFRPCGKVHW